MPTLKEYGTVTVPGEVIEKLAPASDSLVDAWFAETFHNLALPTDLYTRFYTAKERLKAQLRGEG